MSKVDELNDNCFTLSTELVRNLCSEFATEIGEPPSIDELCELILWGIKSNSSDILRNISIENITEIKAKVTKRKTITPKRGDIIAVPETSKLHHLLIYLGRFGSFGHAYGIILGKYYLKPLKQDWNPKIYPRHIFTGLRFVANGKWKIIASMPQLLEQFPDDPEYFHEKKFHHDNPAIGEYGSAETPYKTDGTGSKIRKLSKKEAIKLGISDNDFFQSGMEEITESFLIKINNTEQPT